jgi:hypothetical protein
MRNFIICFAILTFCLYFFLWPRFVNHAAEWDAIAYTAVVYNTKKLSPKNLHLETFSSIKSEVSPLLFDELTQVSSYRRTMAHNPEAFNQQLPFYTTKILYIALLKLCYQYFGFEPLFAMAVLSLLSVILTFALIVLFFNQSVGLNSSVLLSLLVSILSGYHNAASFRLPDPLIMFFSVLVVFAILNRRSLLQIFICGVLAVLLRSDVAVTVSGLIICNGILAFCEDPSSSKRMRLIISHMFAAVFILVGMPVVNWMGGGYNFKVLFHHTFVEYLIYPKTAYVASVTLFEYIYLIKNAFVALILDFRASIGVLGLMLCGFTWLSLSTNRKFLPRGRLFNYLNDRLTNKTAKKFVFFRPILVGLVAYFTLIIRLLIFPLATHRFILPICVIIWVCLLIFLVSWCRVCTAKVDNKNFKN